MDIEKHIHYWRSGAEEDLEVAEVLLEKKKYRYALFFAELAVEKLLKAHVVKTTKDVPPKIHDLLRLSDLSKISLTDEKRRILARLQKYCLEGRYPECLPAAPDCEEAKIVYGECREMVTWLTHQLI